MYPKVQMFIAGEWTDGTSGKSEDILNPATGQPIGKTPHASKADLDRALEASKAGFEIWRGGTGLATRSFSVKVTRHRRATRP